MRSQRENNDWMHRITWAYDHPDDPASLMPHIPWELAEQVWQFENSSFCDLQSAMFSNISTMESLRKYLGFENMDNDLWCTLSTLIYRLLERDDISNIDKVLALIKEFVCMCPHFYSLRFGRNVLMRSSDSADGDAVPVTPAMNAAKPEVDLASP